MILEKQTESNILQEGESQGSIGMSLDLDSAQVLMQMLSKNLYSDSIGSTIRECASNALDSHRRAGVTDPIIVSLVSNTELNYDFSVEDFGTGLDADDVKNIISKYGKSTKRNSNTELGMMGLILTFSVPAPCKKQGELLETPAVKQDNQQPSLSSNTLEGSTTNSQVLPNNVEDSNADKSALPIVIERDKDDNSLMSITFKIFDFGDDIV
jgi:hypothetical protein